MTDRVAELAPKKAALTPKKEGTDTRDRIVRAAADLFYLQGYSGTSLDTVARKAGVNRGSLYYFFRSKKNLVLAVIDYFERLIHQNFIDAAEEGASGGRGRLERLAEFYSGMPRASSPCCGCPIGKLSLELSGLDDDMRLRLKDVWAGVIGRIERMVREAQAEEALHPEADAAILARAFFEQIQGAHIIARTTLDEEDLRADCRRAFESLPWMT
ncbi:MAG TPA: hypothetical protein DDZ83_12000 [Nitrospinae bacterium]|nr:hypothetical protein [Nitrospinota bacterium]